MLTVHIRGFTSPPPPSKTKKTPHILPRRQEGARTQAGRCSGKLLVLQTGCHRRSHHGPTAALFAALGRRVSEGPTMRAAGVPSVVREEHRSPPLVYAGSSPPFSFIYPPTPALSLCMSSGLACADILIPPPNPPTVTYLSERTHQKLVRSFPFPPLPFFPPFPPSV